MMRGRVLIVDCDEALSRALQAGLACCGFAVEWCTSSVDALELLATSELDAVVAEMTLGVMSGIELCERVARSHPGLPVVLTTASGSLELAVAAIRAGATDFMTKPFQPEALAHVLDRALHRRSLREEAKRLPHRGGAGFDEFVGTSRPMRELYDLIDRVAASDVTVLVTGETGVGKELVAQAIHRRSHRRDGPFVAINCAAMPEALLESELFGHARGAFTDAKVARAGLFTRAHGGTFFLDEVADMPLGLQAKVLRALQERVVRPVGAHADIPFDACVIAASNRDLDAAAEEGRFRPDLLYRINVITLPVPPLRARGDDVIALAQHFLERTATRLGKPVVGLSSAVAERLSSYSWPGNVRELQNCIERAVTLTRYDRLSDDDLPERIRSAPQSPVPIDSYSGQEMVSLDEMERRYILHVLAAVGGNKSFAARVLDLDRKTLYRRLERYGAAVGEP